MQNHRGKCTMYNETHPSMSGRSGGIADAAWHFFFGNINLEATHHPSLPVIVSIAVTSKSPSRLEGFNTYVMSDDWSDSP